MGLVSAPSAFAESLPFSEDFEGDLARWRVLGEGRARLVDAEDPDRGRVLELDADGLVVARIAGSEDWVGPVRVHVAARFPSAADAYLGFVWAFDEVGPRVDFGNVYVKSPQGYARVNPFRDGNASRLLYEEYRTPLDGPASAPAGVWLEWIAEISGPSLHLYPPGTTPGEDPPALAFSDLERSEGSIGFHPRIVGAPVRIDDVRVVEIDRLSWSGPDLPVEATPDADVLSEWEVAGPFPAPVPRAESGGRGAAARDAVDVTWRPFAVDRRGAVLTGRVIEFLGGRPVAYFRTVVRDTDGGPAVLHVSSTDELALWVGGRFHGFVYRDGYVSGENDWNAWWDFRSNPDHAGRTIPIDLASGETEIVVRSRAGAFASGGFFAALVRDTVP